MRRELWLLAGILFFFGLVYSFKLLSVPPSLTSDEAAFGYNAALLAKTGHDENGRTLPVFVLSLEGKDWRQPVTQYYLTILFRLFGPSVWLLRFSSVLVALAAAVLLYYLLRLLISRKAAVIGMFLFLTTPVIMMHARMGLDNLMPVPWTLLWLIALVKAYRGDKRWWLVAGIALGINFYTYKAMRAVVPVWTLLTLGVIWWQSKKISRQNYLWFGLGLAPFILAIPLLERLYAGAVFDKHGFSFSNIYDFLYPYLSSFDWSFLFIKGDSTWFHSTQKHGMFLLTLLPLWLAGIYYSLKQKSWLTFWLLAFFAAPLLFGMVNSVHRASRLIYLVPLAAATAAWGVVHLEKIKWGKGVLYFWALLIALNWLDFAIYYFQTYPVDVVTNHAFGESMQYSSYHQLSENARSRGITPYVSGGIAREEGPNGKFFEIIYFGGLIARWESNDKLPPAPALMLSLREDIPGATRLNVDMPQYYLQLVE